MKDELTPQQYRKLRENNSYYNSDTPRKIINKIKSKRTKDGMQLHAMTFHMFLLWDENKWADVCEILKKDLPEIHQFLAEKECIPIPYRVTQLDKALDHKVLGPLIFILILLIPIFLIFMFAYYNNW